MSRLRRFLVINLDIAILSVIFGILSYCNSIQNTWCDLSETYEAPAIFKNESTKYILLWTKYFKKVNWLLKQDTADSKYFENIGCLETKCVITSNRNLMPKHEFDALLFHGAEHWSDIPKVRKREQFYIFALMESPATTFHPLEARESFFNWTMTYRLDSDLTWLYGSFMELETGKVVIPSRIKTKWSDPSPYFYNDEFLDMIRRKSKLAAWFVSNCRTHSQRESLVNELKKYIKVDVYGLCGDLQCHKNSEKCTEMLNTTYKFYFAFENSLCEDYLTEKVFNNMKHLIVPVVYGGVDYQKFLPPHSYIDANKFETPRDLATYLIYLSENPKEYVKYFWWKEHYKIIDGFDNFNMTICNLCQKLHDPISGKRRKVYWDIYAWWNERCKYTPDIKFSNDD